MAGKTSSPKAVIPDLGSLELTEQVVRERAYQFYEERGCEHGHDLEDWLRAEAEIMGRKPSDTATAQEEAPMKAVAAA